MLKIVISSDAQGEGKTTIAEALASIIRVLLNSAGSRRMVEMIDNGKGLTKKKEAWYRQSGCKVLIYVETVK